MFSARIIGCAILFATAGVSYFLYTSEESGGRFAFKLGLDLRGGTHLVYKADVSKIPPQEVDASLEALRDVIERRVNLFGVAEPLVQVERGGLVGEGDHRLIVELPGVTEVKEAMRIIGETPLLEFRLVRAGMEQSIVDAEGRVRPDAFEDTGLTGEFLRRAQVEFGSGSQVGIPEPVVRIDFNAEGSSRFAAITGSNVGRLLAIFLDGNLQSTPIIRERIEGGSAIISGNFTADEARDLVKNLNLGALPLPIALESTQTIGATLGEEALRAGLFSGVVGLIAVALFMVLWYRLPGCVAVVSLVVYIVLMLALFKLIPVTLTAAGIAAFILSIGLAVDANILIAERMKEELRSGKTIPDAIREGFARAWTSIRDSNVTNILSGVILFWFGTSLIQGFALVFVLGTLASMVSAITVSRTFLRGLGISQSGGLTRFLMGSGLR